MTGARTSRLLVRLTPSVAWLVVVVALSVLPSIRVPGQLPAGADKVLHAAEFLVLSGLVSWALAGAGLNRLFLRLLVALPIMAALAGLTELAQRWVPGRSAEPSDLLADVVGILIAALVATVVVALRNRSPVP